MADQKPLFITNPHSVLEAIKWRPKAIQKIQMAKKDTGDWAKVFQMARSMRIRIESSGLETGAAIAPKSAVSSEELFGGENDGPQIWIAIDQVQDPHNLGAIFRSASFYGVRGIILTQDNTAPITSTVYDTASGGVESVPFAYEVNLRNLFKKVKDHEVWVLGSSERAEESLMQIKADRSWLLVVGNEQKGIRRVVLEDCDQVCKIVKKGKGVGSLNVSVACGVMLSHLRG